jgi:hypothetical protein
VNLRFVERPQLGQAERPLAPELQTLVNDLDHGFVPVREVQLIAPFQLGHVRALSFVIPFSSGKGTATYRAHTNATKTKGFRNQEDLEQ